VPGPERGRDSQSVRFSIGASLAARSPATFKAKPLQEFLLRDEPRVSVEIARGQSEESDVVSVI
ncbi:hypothetical protein, partial [Alcanivorax jadensis]|uniref:hypothetical protein n=1 Tax=Alcanivorax jadensis TaxID=64988 RepID=UPI002357895A